MINEKFLETIETYEMRETKGKCYNVTYKEEIINKTLKITAIMTIDTNYITSQNTIKKAKENNKLIIIKELKKMEKNLIEK